MTDQETPQPEQNHPPQPVQNPVPPTPSSPGQETVSAGQSAGHPTAAPYQGQEMGYQQPHQQAPPNYPQTPPDYPHNPYQQQYQQPPYPPQPGYPPQAPEKKRVWPWILAACLLLAILGVEGCVSCVACTAILGEEQSQSTGHDSSSDYANSNTYSLDDIKHLGATLPSTITDGKASLGVYEVGIGKDLEPGLYYLEGSQSAEGSFMVFEKEGADTYDLTASVAYYGHYFAQLEKGDVIVFLGPETAKIYPAGNESIEMNEPILSGCYRVGTDIAAGTYTVNLQPNFPSDASQESAAYVMKDLSWSSDSVLEKKYLAAGGSHTITVTDGQYVELFGASMTPVQA